MEYDDETEFVKGVAFEFDRVNSMVSYGAMAFASTAQVMLSLPSDLSALETAMDGPRALTGDTNMEAGMQGCVDMCNQLRKKRQWVLLSLLWALTRRRTSGSFLDWRLIRPSSL